MTKNKKENEPEIKKEKEMSKSANKDEKKGKKKIDKKDKLIEELKQENTALKDKLIRKTAELDNVIKRCEKEKLDMISYANEKLLLKLLDLVDDMDKAVEAGKESHNPDTILTGVEMIYEKAKKLLEDEGVKAIESHVGKPFDVNFHDAMVSMPSEHPEGTVVQEIQKGYTLRDKVLRHSKVITSSGEPNEKKDANNE